MSNPLKAVGQGLSLVGGISSGNRAFKSYRQGANTAQANTQGIRNWLPTNGYVVGTQGTNGDLGPSFIFGGQTGRVIVAPDNPNATSGGIQFGTPGQTGPGTFIDPNTGQVFNGETGQPYPGGAQIIEPGSSILRGIDLPTFDAAREAAGFGSEIAGRLADLSGEFDILGANAEDLLAISDQAGELLPRVAAGASEMREARLNQLGDAEAATISDLRDSVARRRIAGSSFAQDTESRTRAEFGRRRAEADAQSTLEEISGTAQILQFQAQVTNQAGERLNQMLTGRLGALSSAAQAGLAAGQLSLQTDVAEFEAGLSALATAFGGQAQAQGFVTDILALINQSTGLEIDALTNQGNAFAGLAEGLLNIGTGGGGFGSIFGQKDKLLGSSKSTVSSPSGNSPIFSPSI